MSFSSSINSGSNKAHTLNPPSSAQSNPRIMVSDLRRPPHPSALSPQGQKGRESSRAGPHRKFQSRAHEARAHARPFLPRHKPAHSARQKGLLAVGNKPNLQRGYKQRSGIRPSSFRNRDVGAVDLEMTNSPSLTPQSHHPLRRAQNARATSPNSQKGTSSRIVDVVMLDVSEQVDTPAAASPCAQSATQSWHQSPQGWLMDIDHDVKMFDATILWG